VKGSQEMEVEVAESMETTAVDTVGEPELARCQSLLYWLGQTAFLSHTACNCLHES